MDTIIQIVTEGASADDRRRSEVLRACKTLDDLTAELLKRNFTLSRSATYLRLLPFRSATTEGKRHVKTVPVKLVRAENNERKQHAASNFAYTTVSHLKEACSLMGPSSCAFISCDDKARVPLGLTAANKQAPVMMHMEYRIRLPDHDFVIATKHKLIPSVYAACLIKNDVFQSGVTYSGPTYIAIRSGKHDSSNAISHGQDFDRLLEIAEFKDVLCKPDGTMKPVIVSCVDGGPDENPRFPKTLLVAIKKFKKYDLDVHLCATQAPGRSAFNPVERRMAPLSRELSGVILQHDTYGNHLDSAGKTVNLELEIQNFKKAGQTLASIWSDMVIDKHSVTAEFVEHSDKEELEDIDHDWAVRHVQQSHYILQIVRCTDQECCGPWRSNWLQVFGQRFLPAPYPLSHDCNGLRVPEPGNIIDINKVNFATLSQMLMLIKSGNSHPSYCQVIQECSVRPFQPCGGQQHH